MTWTFCIGGWEKRSRRSVPQATCATTGRKTRRRGAPARCTDGCPVEDTCPFYAPRIYLESIPIKIAVSEAENPILRTLGKMSLKSPRADASIGESHPANPAVERIQRAGHVTRSPSTRKDDAAVLEALRTGPYGRCVYDCDNDVVDHQVVEMTFEDGVTATLTMHGHSHEEGRTLRVDGSRATLLGKFTYSRAWLEVHEHISGEVTQYRFPSEVDQTSGHGGGDDGLMQHFVQVMRGEVSPLTSARDSLESHLMAFGAEESRLEDKVIRMAQFH